MEEVDLAKKEDHPGFFFNKKNVVRTWLYKFNVPAQLFLDESGFLHLAIEPEWNFSRIEFQAADFGPYKGKSVALGYHFDEIGLDWEVNTFQDKDGWCYVLAR